MPPFAKILDLCSTLSHNLTDIIFIGEVAVYLHSTRSRVVPLEASHDADFMISFVDYGVLKDMEEITSNPRLAKHQMIVEGIEFDIYVERLNQLIVPYDEISAHAFEVEGIRAACLEHLLILKLEAFKKRGHSSKGEKDRRDVVKIGLLLGNQAKVDLVQPYMREDLAALLHEVAKSSVFFDLCSNNAHQAKRARGSFAAFVSNVV